MISDILGETMQRIWFTLVAVDSALSCRALASRLNPGADVEESDNFIVESQNLAKASKLIEPFILLYITKPGHAPKDQ